MSLPIAPKDISDKPTKGSVIDPVNKEAKEADVDRKLRFYGVVNAFRDGRMPTNAQIDEILTYTLNHSPVDVKQLSPDGQRLIDDTRDIIETLRLIVQEKNADELLQNFVWHTRDTDFDRAKKDPSEVVPVDKDKAQADAKHAVQHLRTLLSLVATNSEARKLLSDFSVIGRDLLARGASRAAANIAPDQERLANVDASAANDQFISAGGRTVGPDETPIPEVRIPGSDMTIAQHPKAELGTAAEIRTGDGQVRTGAQAANEVQDKAQDISRRAQNEVGEVARQTDGLPQTEEEKEAGKRSIMDKFRGYRDNINDRIPGERKEQLREHRDRAHQFLTEEYFPEERRDQFIFRMKKVILECQKHKDYQESIRWLLSYIEEYVDHSKIVAGHGKDSHQQLTSDPALRQAGMELRTLLERFANGQSLDIIWNAINALADDASNDEELRDWFKGVDTYVRKTLLEPGFILEPACNNEANALRESGKRFYDDKYRGHFDNLFTSVGDFFKAMGDDPLNNRFGQDWARLTRDLLFDSEGSLKFKPELWMDIRKVILPTLVDQVGYVPIPRIEYTDDTMDFVIENLTLSGRNLFPNIVSVETHNFVKFSPYSAIKDEHHHEFTLTLGQIQADMRDVAFWFRKKSGIPKLQDSGLADVVLGGEGLTATVHLSSAEKDKTSVFKVKNVHVKMGTLKFSIRDSKHDLLYKTLRPLATGLVKRQISKAIEDTLTTAFEYIDGQLVGVRNRMAEAKASDDASRREVLAQMFQKKKDEASSIKSGGKDAKFNVVSKRDSVLLPGKGSPSGWINRANERADAATTREDWRSDAFTVL